MHKLVNLSTTLNKAAYPRYSLTVLVTDMKVVGCVVRNCDVTVYPPNLSLGLDVAGKTEEMGKAQVC